MEDLRDRATLFSGFEGIWSNTVVLSGDDPEQLRVGLVTTNFFSLLGAAPALGRTFDASDESPAEPRAILLSAALRRSFASRPAGGGTATNESQRCRTAPIQRCPNRIQEGKAEP